MVDCAHFKFYLAFDNFINKKLFLIFKRYVVLLIFQVKEKLTVT